MSVTWTQNGSGQYLVESKEHILQIMHEGGLFTDVGTPPSNYWASSYLQTSDIDLANDHAEIVPIGNDTVMFTGEYDGGLCRINNWAYTESVEKIGLFGYTESPATLKHIRLGGVCTLSGVSKYAGYLGGLLRNTTVYDVEGNFEPGSTLSGHELYAGVLIGYSVHTSIYGVTLEGTVDFEILSISGNTRVGGICGGHYGLNDGIEQCRNLAYFPHGITGKYVGGIVSYCSSTGYLMKCTNAMRGDLIGVTVGGICGKLEYSRSENHDSLVNSMVGNITSGTGSAGGIIGWMYQSLSYKTSFSRLLNYMNGDITGGNRSGGIIAVMTISSNLVSDIHFTKSVVAMQGAVEHSVRDFENFTPAEMEVTVDTSFGMTFTGNDYGLASMVVDDAFVYAPGFADLPYIDMSGTDPDGNVYEWDFLFANVGGKFDHYTHLSVHKTVVSSPFRTDFGLADDNDVVYLTYANVDENSLYIDSNLSIVETTADIAFDYAKSAIVYGTPDPPTTLVWTKNVDGKFEVATSQHLLQLMNEGSMYTDLGDHPIDYWSSSYVQTSDIDLVNDHADIMPIGNDTTSFTGEYDGDRFQIKNWSLKDIFTSGLFGHGVGAVLMRIRLSGTWTLSGGTYAGFLIGRTWECQVHDIEADFDAGTSLSGSQNIGGFIGKQDESQCHGLTLRGTIDSIVGLDYAGGMVGYASGHTSQIQQFRNLATFSNGLQGERVGGIVAACLLGASNCLNAMRGDMTGSVYAGGLCGWMDRQNNDSSCDSLVNSMTGNISSSGTAGGVFGTLNALGEFSSTKILNYMAGNITGAFESGGICGKIQGSGNIYITKSVVAIQGAVEQSVRGSEDLAPVEMEVTVDTSFGMFYDINDYGSATMVVDDALVYHPSFTDLPYIKLDSTGPDGTEHDWDFVFSNIGGKYEDYTHLSVHKSEISGPLATMFGSVSVDNVYLTYANTVENSLYIDSNLTIVETVAEVVFDHDKSEVIYGTPTPATTVLWTKDDDGKFEVATNQHLLQLMNKGALHTDLGVRPTSYWTHHYVQTAEIDLVDDVEHVVSIGDDDTSFIGSYEHNGFEVLNWQNGDDHSRLFGDRTTLTWTQNADGQYEVATVQHLLQIMERGERFVDEGNFPTDFWGPSASYIQMVDIDLTDWHANIHPIGSAAANFYGQYDGGGHKISNWSFTQPEDSANIISTGFFGVATDAEIKRIRLDGVWTLSGSSHTSTYLGEGFLCGTVTASSVYDIDANFAPGTLLAGGSSTTAPVTQRVGCLIGLLSESVVFNATVRGTLNVKDFAVEGYNTYVGGVIGYVVNAGSSISLCRNVAVFPNGITGNTVGGLLGYLHMGSVSKSLSAMQGDVIGGLHAGGICGAHVAGGSCEMTVNSMTGSIRATANSGGIHGCIDVSDVHTVFSSQLMNYMSGNVEATNAGGVVGLVTRSVETGDVSVSNSVVAMNGTVDQPVGGSLVFEPSVLDAVVNTDFGMVYERQIVDETSLTGFTTHPAFPDLPYIPLADTNPDGNSVEIDFIFANLGGKPVYAGLFTHLSLHTCVVSTPYATDFGLDLANTEVYLTYANLPKSEIFVDDALTITDTAADVAFNHGKTVVLQGTASLPLICQPRALAIKATVDAADAQFQLTYQATSANSGEVVAHHNFTDFVKVITGLNAETTYVVRLYADEALVDQVLVTTAVNSVENYVVSDFFDMQEERYDISKIASKVSPEVVNELFTTGDIVQVDMAFARKTTMEATFVKKGGLIEFERSAAILFPFDPSAAGTQESTMKLSDDTSVQVGLDQVSGDISIGGNLYKSGKSFVIDGKKCTVYDI